jgi:AraC-like DNA-binding protein
MQSKILFPNDIRLRKYIEYFWYIKSGKHNLSEPDTIVYHETCFDVILSFASPTVWKTKCSGREETNGSYLLCGFRKEPLLVDCSEGNVEYLAIRFYPDGLFYFSIDSLYEVNTVRTVGLDDLSGKLWKNLTEKLAGLSSLSLKQAVLETELIKILDSNSFSSSWVVEGTLNYAKKNRGTVNLKKIVDEFGIYPKQLEREFKKHIGTTPKLFLRILRFNNVIKYISLPGAEINWLDTVHKFGYFDQPHFIKEFTNFLGMPPNKFLEIRSSICSDS